MYQHYCALLLLIVFAVSCKGQDPTSQKPAEVREKNSFPSSPLGADWTDKDPYFVETQTINSPYGPNSITRNLVQDKNGHFWLASWEGILRYDGKTFTNFTNQAGLRRFHVFSVLEDSKGNLWFGTIGAGVYRYDGKAFINFTTKDGLLGNSVGCILEDQTGKIWLGTMGGVSCYDGQTFRNFTTQEGLVHNDVNTIVEDKNGKIWFGTFGGVCFYNGQSFSNFNNSEGLPFNNVRSIIEDQNGDLWIGGGDGLCRYDGKSYAKITKDFVGFLYEDPKGTIWMSIGTTNHRMALSRYEEKALPSGQAGVTQIKEEHGQVFGITAAANGDIWFGTEHGICRFDGKSFTYFSE